VSKDQVPADLIEKERAIYTAQAADSGKPAKSSPRWSRAASTSSWRKIRCWDSRSSRIRRHGREAPEARGTKVKSFALFVVGEGIEKKKDDFAAEVAAMAKV